MLPRRFNYDRLNPFHSNDSSPSPPPYSPGEESERAFEGTKGYRRLEEQDIGDSRDVENLQDQDDSPHTPQSGIPLPRLRRKQARSVRSEHSLVQSVHFARGGKGWWTEQMLVDRSLRTMAGLMTIFAIILVSITFSNLGNFMRRTNPDSTAVGGGTGSCKSVAGRNTVSTPIKAARMFLRALFIGSAFGDQYRCHDDSGHVQHISAARHVLKDQRDQKCAQAERRLKGGHEFTVLYQS